MSRRPRDRSRSQDRSRRNTHHYDECDYNDTDDREKIPSNQFEDRSKKLNSGQINSIREWIDEDCPRSLEWLSDKVREVFDIDVSISTVSRYVDDVLAYSYKRLAVDPVRRNRTSTKETRRNYVLRFFEIDGIDR